MTGSAGESLDYQRRTLHIERLPAALRRQEAERFLSHLRVFHYEAGREAVAPHGGPMTVKTVFRGSETFVFGDRRITVRPGQALLVPPQAVYGSEVSEPTETFSAYYPPALRRELLPHPGEDPERRSLPCPLPLLPLRAGEATLEALRRARAALTEGEMGRAEEALVGAAGDLVGAVAGLVPALDALGAASPAVREELLRRVLRVRDHIDDDPAGAASLAELSAVACLSRFHLLRCFRAAFGETPSAYRMRRRLERAREALRRTDRPVNLVGQDLGFASHAAFSRRFRLAFGMTPTAMRREGG